MSRVLVINSGSSSLKYRLIDLPEGRTLASGLIERIGEGGTDSGGTDSGGTDSGSKAELPPVDARHTRSSVLLPESSVGAKTEPERADLESRVWWASTGGDSKSGPAGAAQGAVPDHEAAFRQMLGDLEPYLTEPIAVVGHRVVHGGERFVEPTLVTPEVEQAIEELSALAPLHNPPNLAGIRAARVTFPGVPQVAIFDTAFHRSLPPAARSYAIDADLAARYGIRRFGFHGISFEYVSAAAARALGRPLKELKLIVLHLGNGASACAVRGGESVETSMGLTPLEGLMMGTRGGDIDPGILIYLQRRAGLGPDELDELLNHRSGLLGLAGHNDIRDVQAAADGGDEAARLAIEVYCRRIRGYIGNYFAQLGGADAVVFTGGVGEHNARVRELSFEGLDALGMTISTERNLEATGQGADITGPDSKVRVLVVPTDEELEIARQSLELVERAG